MWRLLMLSLLTAATFAAFIAVACCDSAVARVALPAPMAGSGGVAKVVFTSASLERWTVPDAVTSVTLEVAGGQGAAGATAAIPEPGPEYSGNAQNAPVGGKGANVIATLAVVPGETLEIEAGEKGHERGEGGAPLGYQAFGVDADGGQGGRGDGGGGSGVAILSGGPVGTVLVAGGGGGAGFGTASEDNFHRYETEETLETFFSAGGAGGASEGVGGNGAPAAGPGCSDPGGEGGRGATVAAPGQGGNGGLNGCASHETSELTVVGGNPPEIQAKLPHGECPGAEGEANGTGGEAECEGGGGGGGYRGGGGGGQDSNTIAYHHRSGQPTQEEFFAPGGGGGGGGSNYVAPSLTGVTVENGTHEGGGVVVVSYLPPGVDIQTGPAALTNLHSATFEFSSVLEDVYYECALDGKAFEVCASPMSYSNLADGSHTFEVRAVPNGGTPTRATVRTWTIENTVPQAQVTVAPSGNVKENTAKIEWVSSTRQAGVTYVCQLDAQPSYACTSPQRVAGLSVGHHDFYITASNQFGEASPAPTTVEWNVVDAGKGGAIGLQPPATASCAAPASTRASSGLLFMVGREGTCLTPSQVKGEPAWVATGPVTVDGIGLIPQAGSRILLSRSPAAVLETTGPTSLRLGTREAVPVPFAFTWAQNSGSVLSAYQGLWKNALTAKPQSVNSAGHPPAEMSFLEKFAGLGVLPVWPTIELSSENGGTAKIGLQVTLPRTFTPLPTAFPGGIQTTTMKSSLNGVGGSLGVTASNENGVSVNGSLSIDSTIWLGPLSVSGLRISFESQTETFSGNMNLGLVGTSRQIGVGITIGPEGQPAVLGCCIQKLSIAPQNLNIPLFGSPVLLQSIEGSLGQEVETVAGRQQTFAKFGGGIGLSGGPKELGVAALELKGSAAWLFSSPYVFEVSGQASVLGFPTRNAKLTYKPGVEWKLSGNIDETLLGYGFTAAIKNSFFQGTEQFNVEGEGETVFPLIGRRNVKVVLSNKGIAACSEESGLAGGLVPPFTFGWAILFPSKTPTLLSDSCDLGPYTATASRYHATAAGATRTIRITGRPEAHVIKVTGESAAPEVTVTGPGGLALHSGTARQSGGLIISQDASDETDILLANGTPGAYSITSSNTPITATAIASELPSVDDRVTVRRAAGARLRLTYHQTTAPGEQLELIEQGAPGTGRLLKTTSADSGTFSFTPATGLGAHRHILAITLNHGLPRHDETLAPFTVDESPAGRVTGLSRRHDTLTWRADPRAARYAVAFYNRHQIATSTTVTSRRQTAIPSGTLRAAITPIDSTGRPGPTSTITLTPARKTHHRQ